MQTYAPSQKRGHYFFTRLNLWPAGTLVAFGGTHAHFEIVRPLGTYRVLRMSQRDPQKAPRAPL